MRLVTVLLIAALPLGFGCAKKSDQAAQEPDPAAARETGAQDAAAAIVAVDLASRNVSCGCVIEEIGHCGNYIEIDGSFVPIANSDELGLGPMEWCGKENVTAQSSGELRDGEFHADTLEVAASD